MGKSDQMVIDIPFIRIINLGRIAQRNNLFQNAGQTEMTITNQELQHVEIPIELTFGLAKVKKTMNPHVISKNILTFLIQDQIFQSNFH